MWWYKSILMFPYYLIFLGIFCPAITGKLVRFGNAELTDDELRQDKKDSMDLMNNKVFPKSRFPESDSYMPSLHRCVAVGEAFSGSYLISSEHLLKQKTDYPINQTYGEMGCFMMFRHLDNPFRDLDGAMMQSVDVLDFSVLHLSPFERIQNRHVDNLGVENLSNINETMSETLYYIKHHTLHLLKKNETRSKPEYKQTVVIIPFLGAAIGDGHSSLLYRGIYLQACFWSYYLYYEHIVIAVASPIDAYYVKKILKLPVYDLLEFPTLTKLGSLPIVMINETKTRIQSHQWHFQYIFYTEADNILLMRIADDLYHYLQVKPRRVLIPHRINAYPSSVILRIHKRMDDHLVHKEVFTNGWEEEEDGDHHRIESNDTWETQPWECCQAKHICAHRKDWVHIQNGLVPMMKIYGLIVPLGNSNFHKEYFRECKLYKHTKNKKNKQREEEEESSLTAMRTTKKDVMERPSKEEMMRQSATSYQGKVASPQRRHSKCYD